MLHDPIAMYEDARRKHQERLASSARRRVLRQHRLESGFRSEVAAVLRRAADAVDGRRDAAWRPGYPFEDA
jgi:hypothetical protein